MERNKAPSSPTFDTTQHVLPEPFAPRPVLEGQTTFQGLLERDSGQAELQLCPLPAGGGWPGYFQLLWTSDPCPNSLPYP